MSRQKPFFTPRQEIVLRLLAQGYSGKEAARRLGVSYFTIKHHITCAKERTGINSTYRLIAIIAAADAIGVWPCP